MKEHDKQLIEEIGALARRAREISELEAAIILFTLRGLLLAPEGQFLEQLTTSTAVMAESMMKRAKEVAMKNVMEEKE